MLAEHVVECADEVTSVLLDYSVDTGSRDPSPDSEFTQILLRKGRLKTRIQILNGESRPKWGSK